MKKTLLRSIFAAIVLCFATVASAQQIYLESSSPYQGCYEGAEVTGEITASIDVGGGWQWDESIGDYVQTSAADIPDGLKVTLTAPAGYELSKTVLTAEDLQAYTTIECKFTLPALTDEEKAAGYKYPWTSEVITVTVENAGDFAFPEEIQFEYIRILAAVPQLELGYITGKNALYKDQTYTFNIDVTGNLYVESDVTLTLAGNGATFKTNGETSLVIAAQDIKDSEVYVEINVVPTELGEHTYTVTMSSDDLAEPVVEEHKATVAAAEPSLSFEPLTVRNAVVGELIEKSVTLNYTPFVTEDITIESLTEGLTLDYTDPSTYVSSQVTAYTLKPDADYPYEYIYFTYTPTVVSEEPIELKIKATAHGKEAIAVITLTQVSPQTPVINRILLPYDWNSYEALKEFTPVATLDININKYFPSNGGKIRLTCTSHPNDVDFGSGYGQPHEINVSDFSEAYGSYSYKLTIKVTPSNPEDGEVGSAVYVPYTFKAEHIDGNPYTAKAVEGTQNYSITKVADTETALENAQVEVEATKVIENGQIYIIKNGVRYNVLGTIVK